MLRRFSAHVFSLFRALLLIQSLALPIAVISVSTMMVGGCASKPIDESDPAQLYQDAEDEIKSDHYQIAIDKLRIIKNKFPYSKYSIDAQLRIADVLFLQDSFAEAATAYETFRDLHPKHDKVPYAMFRAAKSYFLDIPDPIARDLTPAQKSLDAYNEFLKRFPTDANSVEGKKDVAKIRNLLAEKELYIGDFYLKRDYLESAKPRFQKILTFYADTDFAKEAQERIAKIDKRLSENPANSKSKDKDSDKK